MSSSSEAPPPDGSARRVRSSLPPPLRSVPPPAPSTGPPDVRPSLIDASGERPPVVIVGAGPVGIHVARELLHRAPGLRMVLYGDEPWEPYNRVLLSELLAGDIDWAAITNPPPLIEAGRLELKINNRVAAIDRINHAVVDSVGNRQPYWRLVLATGSQPYVPAVASVRLLGIYTYRNVNDAQTLMTNATQSRSTVVLGGGVLGVEVARALKTQNAETRIVLVHRGGHLMSRELEHDAARLLERNIREAGIEVRLRETIAEILGEGEIRAVMLATGEVLDCDTLVLCTGIERNTRIAREAGLEVGRGIKVDDRMRTSDRRIYAVGECVEHRGEVYGLLAPGIEQAKVAATRIAGGPARYTGSDHYLRLKVVKVPVCSIRRTHADQSATKVLTHGAESGQLRRLYAAHARLVGATSVGDWPELDRIHQTIVEQRRVWPWQLSRFRREGRLWPERADGDVRLWPDSVTVCACMGVTCGMIRQAMAEGFGSVDALRERTGASQACASCRPVLAQLTGGKLRLEAPRTRWGLLVGSVVTALLVAVMLGIRPIAIGRSAIHRSLFDRLLLDATWKQTTGFVALGLVAASMVLTARKRVRRFQLGDFPFWRGLHVLLTTLVAGVLVLHTGGRLGQNFNLAVMLAFLAVLTTGAAVGVIFAGRDGAAPVGARRWIGTHLLLVWLLPALVALHVVSVYYF